MEKAASYCFRLGTYLDARPDLEKQHIPKCGVVFFLIPLGRLCAAVASFVKRDFDGKCELQWSLSDFEPEMKTATDHPVDSISVLSSLSSLAPL
jgi:hypothetical protein